MRGMSEQKDDHQSITIETVACLGPRKFRILATYWDNVMGRQAWVEMHLPDVSGFKPDPRNPHVFRDILPGDKLRITSEYFLSPNSSPILLAQPVACQYWAVEETQLQCPFEARKKQADGQ